LDVITSTSQQSTIKSMSSKMDVLPMISPRSPRGKSSTTTPRTPNNVNNNGIAFSGDQQAPINLFQAADYSNGENNNTPPMNNKQLLLSRENSSKGSMLSLPPISPAIPGSSSNNSNANGTSNSRRGSNTSVASIASNASTNGGSERIDSVSSSLNGSVNNDGSAGGSGDVLAALTVPDSNNNNSNNNTTASAAAVTVSKASNSSTHNHTASTRTGDRASNKEGKYFTFPDPAAEPPPSSVHASPLMTKASTAAATSSSSSSSGAGVGASAGPPVQSSVYTHLQAQLHTHSRSSRIESTDNVDFSYMASPSIQYASATASKDGTLLTVDDKFARLCEYHDPNDIIGRNIIDLTTFESPDEMMLATCTISALSREETWTCPLKANAKYGLCVTVIAAPQTPSAANAGPVTPTNISLTMPASPDSGTSPISNPSPSAAARSTNGRTKKVKDTLRIVITPNVTYTFPRRDSSAHTSSHSTNNSGSGTTTNNVGWNASGGGGGGGTSTFSARLPSELSTVDQEQLYVLVVDDSVLVTAVIGNMLRQEGYKVIVENSGQSALARLKNNLNGNYPAPDTEEGADGGDGSSSNNNTRMPTIGGPTALYAVLVDVNMPGMGGLQVCHEFRALEEMRSMETATYIHQVLIGMTGDFSATIVHEVMAAGFDGFLPKPFSAKKFREVINGLAVD
jgi:CheY-like chemotaxis protein